MADKENWELSEDEKFGKKLYEMRKTQGISQKNLAMGICTKSSITKIEKGLRMPEWYFRNIVLSRLGYNCELYEEYIQPKEYAIWEDINELLCLVEEKKFDSALKQIKICQNKYCDNNIIMQVIYDMMARIQIYHNNEANENIAELYEKAVLCTIPLIDMKVISNMNLSIQEMYILITYLNKESRNNRISTVEKYKYYEMILKKIKDMKLDHISRSKIMPYLVISYYNCNADLNNIFENIDNISILLDEALLDLRKSGRTYYIEEIVEKRIKLYEIKATQKKLSNCEITSRDKLIKIHKIIISIYNRYYPERNMELNCYVYKGTHIHSIGDVIYKRRNMLDMTQEDLAQGICDKKTIRRIEKNEGNIQREIVRNLFEKLGLSRSLIRGNIIADDSNINKVISYANEHNDGEILSIDELKMLMDKNNTKSPSNRQTIIRIYSVIKRQSGEMDEEKYKSNIKIALQQTIPMQKISKKEGFLSKYEVICLYNLLTEETSIDENSDLQSYLYKNYVECDYKYIYNNLSIYMLISFWFVSIWGNNKEYDKSNKLSEKVIRNMLSANRMIELHRYI